MLSQQQQQQGVQQIEVNNDHKPQISLYSQTLVREGPIFERLYGIAKLQQQLAATAAKDGTLNNNGLSSNSNTPNFNTIDFDPITGQRLFYPVTNSPHTVPLPPRDGRIEDLLYNDAEKRKNRQQAIVDTVLQEEEAHRNASKLTDRSRKLAQKRQLKEIQTVFDTVDKNNDGRLTFEQIGLALKLLGIFRLAESGSEKRDEEEEHLHQKIWALADSNQSGFAQKEDTIRLLSAALELDGENASESEVINDLARDIKQLSLNKLAYGSAVFKSPSSEPQFSFAPTINPKSRMIEAKKAWMEQELHSLLRAGSEAKETEDLINAERNSTTSSISGPMSPRFERLFRKRREIDQKLVAERQEKERKEMEECTFAPKINKPSTKPKPAKSIPLHERLYAHSQKPRKQPLGPTMAEEEIAKNCTFRPQSYTRYFRNNQPSSGALAPRDYQKAVERLRRARDEREQHEREQFHSQLRSTTQQDKATSHGPQKATKVKPFTFELDKRRRSRPILYMDVNLGPGKTGRIGIHQGDNPGQLASNFAASYGLDEALTRRLEELLRQHMEAVMPTVPLSRIEPSENTPLQEQTPTTSPYLEDENGDDDDPDIAVEPDGDDMVDPMLLISLMHGTSDPTRFL